MSQYDSDGDKDTASRTLTVDLDRTDDSTAEYYGREDVYAANCATEGQSHE